MSNFFASIRAGASICVAKLRGFFRQRETDGELKEELDGHLQLLAERFVEGGMAPREAAAAARRQFGNAVLLRQQHREMRIVLWVATLGRDVRFALRQLRRNPLFTSIAVLSIALGIGANTAVFTLLDQLVLRLLPVKDPQQLVLIWTTGPHMGSNDGPQTASYPMYQDFGQKATAFDYVFCRFDTPVAVGLGIGSDGTERANAELVSGNFFQALSVGPALGRVLASDTDDRVYEGHPSVVLSHLYWMSRFGGDRSVVGKKILVNQHWMEVVGVAAAGFSGLDPSSSPDMWVPILMKPWMTPGRDELANRRSQWVHMFGRMKPGYTVESARASLEPLFHQILQQEVSEPALSHLSIFDRGQFLSRRVETETAASGYSALRREYATALKVLMAMAALTLLIVCSNVANLLIARASARQQEIAVRLAIGASRKTLVIQLLVESLLLSFAGAIAGMGLAVVATRGLLGMLPRNGAALTLHATPDWRILLFGTGMALAVGLLFGLAPALQSTQPYLQTALKDGVGATGGSSARTRKTLVALQIAFSFLLLAGAGLFTRTLINLKNLRTGYADMDSLVTFQVDPSKDGYTLPRIRSLYTEVQGDLQAAPGAKSAAYSMFPLLDGSQMDISLAVEGHVKRDGENMQALYNVVSPGFWKAAGIPLLQGRDFTIADRSNGNDSGTVPTVAIVNRALTERFFGKENPVGRHVGCCRGTATKTDIEIVGLVENSIVGDPRFAVESEVFFPYLQSTIPKAVSFYVRSETEPSALFPVVKNVFARRDRTIPVFDFKTLTGQVNETLSTERLIASLSVVFGGVATVLAAVGLYGVMAFAVGRRTKEIGLRMAVGASRASVAWMVLREALRMLAVGLAGGIVCALVLSRYVTSQLFGVQPTDLGTYIMAGTVLGLVALVSALMPARRASEIDPLTALRYE